MNVHPAILAAIMLSIIALVLVGGMQANWRDMIDSLRRPVWLARAVLAVSVVVPFAALLLCLLLPIDSTTEVAIMIMAASPLAPPVSLKLMGTGADASRVEAHFALLTLLSVVLVPVTLALASLALGTEVTTSVAEVARIAFMLLLAPVAIGVTIGTYKPEFARSAARIISKVAYLVLGVLSLYLLVGQLPAMVRLMGDGSLIAMVLISVVAVAAGHLIGGPQPRNRLLLASAAVVRHPGISLMVVASNKLPAEAVAAVLLFLLVNLIVSAGYQRWAKAGAEAGEPALQG